MLKTGAFILAGLFVFLWIFWAVLRSRYQKDGIETLKSSKRNLAIIEGAALIVCFCFGVTVYFLW